MNNSLHSGPTIKNPYLQHLMLDVKNMRVKHVRKMFVLLREVGTELHLSDMEKKTDWAEYEEFNKRLSLLVVQHGLTLGEFATGYVLNVQARQRGSSETITEHDAQNVVSETSKKRKPEDDLSAAKQKIHSKKK
jgi:hypothetical protein